MRIILKAVGVAIAVIAASPTYSQRFDSSWTLTVGGQSVAVNSDGSFRIPNISAPDAFGVDGPGTGPDFVSDDFVRLSGTGVQQGKQTYVFSEPIRLNQGRVAGIDSLELTFTDIPPRKPESLSIVLGNRTAFIGQDLPLTVLAHFPDGTTTNVAPKTSWTSYRISNPNIATISPDGVVTPLKPGVVYVTAVNEGVATTCGLNIVAGTEGFTIVTGTVVDTNGVPIAGAVVLIYDLIVDPVTTDANGRFTISNVPTTLGKLSLGARIMINNRAFVASLRLQGVSGGLTQAGLLTVHALAFTTANFAVGAYHTVALRNDGTLWAWGRNVSGQLGNGTLTTTNTPQQIGTATAWQAVAAGDYHTVALRGDGTLWSWGANFSGQLGNGTFTSTNTPQQIATNATWQAVVADSYYTVALRADGSLWAWGDNSSGQLGNGTFFSANTPQRVGTGTVWQSVAAGSSHTVALRPDGTLWAWGDNSAGQLGNGTNGYNNAEHATPQQIGTNTTWKAVAAGASHTVALQADGTLWAWGNNGAKQLGEEAAYTENTPQHIGTNASWKAVAAGHNITGGVRSDGTLWAWGDNRYYQLGNDATAIHSWQIALQHVATNVTWQGLAFGSEHTVASRTDGTLWAWGRNDSGQLGNGTVPKANSPQRIGTDEIWQAVATGYDHALALRADGALWAWGYNGDGQLGNGTYLSTDSPQQVGTNETWQTVAPGRWRTVALRADGTLWEWGRLNLGAWLVTTTNAPRQTGTNTAWQTLASGDAHTVALRTDGTLWTWGYNGNGQLGSGNYNSADAPQQVGTHTNWLTVAAGDHHTLALQTDGTLWAWGWNVNGQLGNGTNSYASTTPQWVGTNSTWNTMAAGNRYTIALRVDGTLWAWGYNESGQLGIGTFDDANAPKQIGTNANWQAVAAGSTHTVALRNDGTLWAWGSNFSGQLGNNDTFTSANTPQRIGTNATWQALAAGSGYTVAVRRDGSLWGWGSNGSGQIAQPVPWLPYPVLGGAVWGPPRP